MHEDVIVEDVIAATRARARMHQKIDQEVLADTFTPERYAELYQELQREIQDLQLPTWWTKMTWESYLMTSAFFDKLVYDTRELLKKRGVATDEDIEKQVTEFARSMY